MKQRLVACVHLEHLVERPLKSTLSLQHTVNRPCLKLPENNGFKRAVANHRAVFDKCCSVIGYWVYLALAGHYTTFKQSKQAQYLIPRHAQEKRI